MLEYRGVGRISLDIDKRVASHLIGPIQQSVLPITTDGKLFIYTTDSTTAPYQVNEWITVASDNGQDFTGQYFLL